MRQAVGGRERLIERRERHSQRKEIERNREKR